MARIEYLYTEGRSDVPIGVRLDDKYVGDIRPVLSNGEKGWRYFPKGQKTGGDLFKTAQACADSLQDDTSPTT